MQVVRKPKRRKSRNSKRLTRSSWLQLRTGLSSLVTLPRTSSCKCCKEGTASQVRILLLLSLQLLLNHSLCKELHLEATILTSLSRILWQAAWWCPVPPPPIHLSRLLNSNSRCKPTVCNLQSHQGSINLEMLETSKQTLTTNLNILERQVVSSLEWTWMLTPTWRIKIEVPLSVVWIMFEVWLS